nr:CBS domain-containing protein [Accumulibacter sp.]
MVPRPLMEVVDVGDSLQTIIERVNSTAHSRFPVICDSPDNVIGILLAKDLLRVERDAPFSLRDWVRPAASSTTSAACACSSGPIRIW